MHKIEKCLRKAIDKENDELGNWFKNTVDMVQTIAHNRGWKFRILTEFAGVLQQDHYTTGLIFSQQHMFTYTHLYLKNKNDWDRTSIDGAFINDTLSRKFRIPYISKARQQSADQISSRLLKEHELRFEECIKIKEGE